MTDKRLVTTVGDYEAGGSVEDALLEKFKNFFLFWFRAGKKIKTIMKNV